MLKVIFVFLTVYFLLDVPVASTGVKREETEDAWGFIGGEVNLTCEVPPSEPPPTFKWSSSSKNPEPVQKIYEITHESILQIRLNNEAVFGSYNCTAKNQNGIWYKTYVLRQGVQPPPPDFIDRHGASSDLLDIEIAAPKLAEDAPDNLIEGFKVEFKPSNEKHWKYKYFPLNDSNSYPLTDLHHDTEYDIRVATKNKAGFSVYSKTSTFRTLKVSSTDSGSTANSPWILLLHIAAAISLW